MPIEIYPSKLEGEPAETHSVNGETVFLDWLTTQGCEVDLEKPQPISIEHAGRIVPPAEWASLKFGPDDTVRVFAEPKGAELIIAAVTLSAAFKFVTGLFIPKLPGQNKQGAAQGDRLAEAAVKGNSARLNTPIREIAGRRKVYPDYLAQPHRYFEDTRRQVVSMLLCVGKGEYDAPASGILIGETPLISLGDDATYQVYGPGQSVAADARAQNWFNAPEVGSSSTGNAGLELTASFDIDSIADASAYQFSGYSVVIPAGAGSFPAGWTSGQIVRIDARKPYTVIDGGAGADIIQGDFSELAPFVGMNIEIVGDNEGIYEVASYTPGSPGEITLNYMSGDPAIGLSTGVVSMSIGYAGLRYRLTAASTSTITVERLTDTGATDGTWPGFITYSSSAVSISLDGGDLEGGWRGPFTACPDGEVTSTIENDFFFPGGLIHIGSKGQLISRTVTAELQYRDFNTAGGWTSVSYTFTDKTTDQIGFTRTINLPYPMRAEVRVRRIGAKTTDPNKQETIHWYGLRSMLPAPSSYAGVTTLALKIAGGDKIASQSESLVSMLVTRKLPPLGGGAPVATRNIAPWVQHVVSSIGYGTTSLDTDALAALDAVWSARGDYYDDAINDRTTVKAALQDALAAGFAELTIDNGKIRPVRDQPRTVYDSMYTPQNMTSQLVRSFESFNPDDFNGVDVEYFDESSWQIETVKCRLPGDAGTKVETMRVNGVTNKTRAWRIGMRRRRAQVYRRKNYSFNTEMDSFNSRYLDYVALGDDVPGYGQSAIVEAILASGSGHIIRSSEPLVWTPAVDHMVAIRRKDGTLSGPYSAGRLDDFNFFITGLDFTPDTSWSVEPPHLLFGPVNNWNYPALITDVSPSGNKSASVTAFNYDERIYADDDNSPP